MKESSLSCGRPGIYNSPRKDFSDRLGDRKPTNTIATGATEVVTANPGCYLQLRSTLKRNGGDMDVKYIVELLDEAYGGPDVSEWALDHSAHRSS
jgi:glycolate oxidase iron-sulfur subunit